MSRRFNNFGIERDSRTNTSRAVDRQLLPLISSLDLPPPTLPGIGSGIAFDIITQRPYYSDGFNWFPMGTGSPGTVESYNFVKDGIQVIVASTNTAIASWEITSSDTYHTIPGWDLTTGVYTAPRNEVLTIEVNISWAAGVSNLGDRILRIQHMKLGIPGFVTVKEASTQADPDMDLDTTQNLQAHLQINQGDAVRISVEHDAPVALSIVAGVRTGLSGFRVQIT